MNDERKRRAPRRNNPDGARQAILDAAEKLLAERGYYGVTMREIAAEAGLKLNMLTYHFGTKDELYARVIKRRAPEYLAAVEAELDAALAAAGAGRPAAEAILLAFLRPSFGLSMRGGAGWKSYMQLLAQAMGNRQTAAFLQPARELFDPLLKRFVQVFRQARPDVDELRIHWAFYLVEAAMTHILTEAGIVNRHSDGRCRSSDLDRVLDEMVPFFSRGFAGLAGGAETGGRAGEAYPRWSPAEAG